MLNTLLTLFIKYINEKAGVEDMLGYNISSFIRLMQTYLTENNTQEATGRLLLESIEIQDPPDINARMITNLVKRNNDVLKIIKKASTKPKVIANAIHYFEDVVVPDLNIHLQDDTCSKIIYLLRSDTSVPESKSNELAALHHKDKIGEFLAKCFLYAVSRPNKKSKKGLEIENESFDFNAQNTYRYHLQHESNDKMLESEIQNIINMLENIKQINKSEKSNSNILRLSRIIVHETSALLDNLTKYVLRYYQFSETSFSETSNFESIVMDVEKHLFNLEHS